MHKNERLHYLSNAKTGCNLLSLGQMSKRLPESPSRLLLFHFLCVPITIQLRSINKGFEVWPSTLNTFDMWFCTWVFVQHSSIIRSKLWWWHVTKNKPKQNNQLSYVSIDIQGRKAILCSSEGNHIHQNAGHVMQYQLESKSFLVAVEDTRSFLFHWIDSSIHNQSIILISQSHTWCDLTDNRFQGLNVNSISCISHFTDSSQGLIWCTFDRFITEKLPKQKGEKGKRQTLFLWRKKESTAYTQSTLCCHRLWAASWKYSYFQMLFGLRQHAEMQSSPWKCTFSSSHSGAASDICTDASVHHFYIRLRNCSGL